MEFFQEPENWVAIAFVIFIGPEDIEVLNPGN